MTRRRLIAIALLLLMLPAVLVGLMATESGSRWLLGWTMSSIPGETSVNKIEGDLLGHLVLRDVRHSDEKKDITAKKLELAWQPGQLFSGKIKINDVIADDVSFKILKSTSEPTQESEIKDEFPFPFQLDIDNFLLTQAQLQTQDASHVLDKLHLSVNTVGDKINLTSFSADADIAHITANGFILPSKGLPLNLNLHWQVNVVKNEVWEGSTVISGDMNKLSIDNQLTQPFDFIIKGNVHDVLKAQKFDLQGNWQKLVWPIATQPPQIQSPKGHFQLSGTPNAYRLTLNGQLVQQHLPDATLDIVGEGGLGAFKLGKLEIKANSTLLKLSGVLVWKPLFTFDLTATGQNFNPALFMPELPGNLALNSHIQGVVNPDPKGMQITAELSKFSGTLRNKPFNASGKAFLRGNQVKIDNLNITSGSNKLAVNGHVNHQEGDLQLKIDMPDLAGLWPTLAGNLNGDGQLHGGWDNPFISLNAKGRKLSFGGQSAEIFDLAMDYFADSKKKSQLSMTASNIKLGGEKITDLKLTGNGTLRQHSFAAEINSPAISLSMALDGSWQNRNWRGEISRVNLTEANDKLWSLASKVPARFESKPDGVDVTVNEACLTHQDASICGKGALFANSGFNVSLIAKSLPGELIKPMLPPNLSVSTLLDGKAKFQRKNKSLDGNYTFTTNPTLVSVKDKDTIREIKLKSSSLSGSLKGDEISANLGLNLAGEDYLRTRLLLNIGKSPSISGQVTASIVDFSPIQAFAPQLSNVEGRLAADLNLQGQITNPEIKGYLDLVDAGLDTGQLGLRNLNLHANIAGKNGDQIQLHGSTVPILINKPEAEEMLDLHTQLNFTANLRQKPTVSGEFKFNLPEKTTLSIVSPEKRREVVLGASSLSGMLANNALFANLDIALSGQDYLHGKLEMATHSPQALSGKLTAAIHDFSVIEAFSPELANIKGLFTADLLLGGTSKNLSLDGSIHLADGSVDVGQLGINVHDIDMLATTPALTGQLIQLRGSATSGKGNLALTGSVQLPHEAPWSVTADVSGKDFEAAKLPEAEIAVSPNLKIVTTNNLTNISGELAIPKAILKIQDIPENAVKVSPDEIILGEEKTKGDTIKAPGIHADVAIKLGKQVSFSGQGLQTDLNGNLHVIKTDSKMTMQGDVNMANASYKSYGQNLTVRKGQFSFNGPVDNPWLNVEAVRQSKDKKVTAILTLGGTLDSPQTRISSQPALPETEALAYLLTGRPLSQASQSDSNMLASAAISYGADQASWLAEQLGISEFGVQQGNTLKDTLLVMGKYLTPDFYLGAKVGMFNKQAVLVLKHKVIDSFNVETQAGTSQRIKLNYEFDGE